MDRHEHLAAAERPTLRAWRACTARLVAGYSGVVHQSVEGYQTTSCLVQSAADVVWRRCERRAAPCWSRLDVPAWLRQLEASPPWAGDWRGIAVATLRGFLTWLVDEGHVEAGRIAPVLAQLQEVWA
jgi:hypothetical protein